MHRYAFLLHCNQTPQTDVFIKKVKNPVYIPTNIRVKKELSDDHERTKNISEWGEMIMFTSVFGKNCHVTVKNLGGVIFWTPRATMTLLSTSKGTTNQAKQPAVLSNRYRISSLNKAIFNAVPIACTV